MNEFTNETGGSVRVSQPGDSADTWQSWCCNGAKKNLLQKVCFVMGGRAALASKRDV
jgi:hypothetical protein